MEADPDELLAWLKGDGGGERDLQISALEQLCKLWYFKFSSFIVKSCLLKFNNLWLWFFLGMLVLMCDNIDRCFEQ